MARLQLVPVVGQAKEGLWSQVLALPYGIRLDEVFFGDGRRVVIAVTLAGEGVETKGSEWLNGLRSQDEAIFQEYPFATSWLQERVKSFPEVVSLVALGFTATEVVCVGYGGARVVLKRGEQVGSIMTAPDKGWLLKRGKWLAGDKYLVGTKGLVGEMSDELVGEVLAMETATLGGEELVTRVQAAEDSAGAAGWLIEGMMAEELGEEEIKTDQAEDVPDKPQVYLRKPKKRKRQLLLVALGLLIALGLSVSYSWQKREAKKWEAKYQSLVQQVEPLVQAAKEGMNTNRTEAKKELDEAVTRLEQALPEYTTQPKIKTLIERKLAEVRELAVTVSGEQNIAEVPVWVDLALVKEGFYGEQLAVAGKLAVVLDRQNGLLMTVDGQTKEAKLAAGGQLLVGAKIMAATTGRVVTYGTAGLVDVAILKKTTDVLKAPEAEWKEIVSAGMFAGNVYLLDKGEGTIWQYPGLTAGVGTRRRWLANQKTLNTKAMDMAIDGDVWVLSDDGGIERYRRGAKENFTVTGMGLGFKQVAAIFTSEEVPDLYVLDQGNGRVVVLSKDGVYQKQYAWKGFSAVTDIVVLPLEKALLGISGSSLYRISLE